MLALQVSWKMATNGFYIGTTSVSARCLPSFHGFVNIILFQLCILRTLIGLRLGLIAMFCDILNTINTPSPSLLLYLFQQSKYHCVIQDNLHCHTDEVIPMFLEFPFCVGNLVNSFLHYTVHVCMSLVKVIQHPRTTHVSWPHLHVA